MARAKPPVVAPAGRQGGPEAASRQSAVTIARALACVTLVGLAVLFVWLTIRVDLVIFAGVLFGVCLRRTAATPHTAADRLVSIGCVSADPRLFRWDRLVLFGENKQPDH
jgi:hypothetical protein